MRERPGTRCRPPSKTREVTRGPCFHQLLKSFSPLRSARPSRGDTRISRSSTCSTRWRTIPTASASSRRAAPICRRCGAPLATYLDESIERLKRGEEREPEQTLAFRRVLSDRRAARPERAARRSECGRRARGDPSAAEKPRGAAPRRPGHHAPRHPRTTSRTASRRRRRRAGSVRSRATTSGDGILTSAPAAAPIALHGVLRQPHRARAPGTARSADRPRPKSSSARSKCSAAGARTIRCSSASRASARRRWPKASPRACCTTMCRER